MHKVRPGGPDRVEGGSRCRRTTRVSGFPVGSVGRTRIPRRRSRCRRRRPRARRTCCTSCIDDIGFGWIEPFGGLIRTPNIAAARRERSAVHELHDHGAVLADARRASDGAQPPLGGDGEHPRARDRASPATTRGSRRTRPASGRCCTSTATRASAWASGTTRRRRRPGSPVPYDRWPTGPVFGFDRFYGFFGRRLRPVVPEAVPRSRGDRSAARCPRRATTCPRISPSAR